MACTSDDPVVAREFEAIGCIAVMPPASLIGSGKGILNPWTLENVVGNASVPMTVDPGVDTPATPP